jgi:hypothetical protein
MQDFHHPVDLGGGVIKVEASTAASWNLKAFHERLSAVVTATQG